LETLKQELASKEFQTEFYNGNCNLITNIPDALTTFQDHLITCDRLLENATAQNLYMRIEIWSKKLQKGQDVLELMETLQALFTELNPLFELPDYASQFSQDENDDFSSSKKVMIMMVSLRILITRVTL
jgi:hypothetical protein